MKNIKTNLNNGQRSLLNDKFATFVDVGRYKAKLHKKEIAFTFLKDGEVESGSLTFQQVDEKARAIARELQSVVKQGERALLLFEPGLEFISAFFACLYAGVIAVPAYPPRAGKLHFKRLELIAQDASPSVILTNSEIQSKVINWQASTECFVDLNLIITDQVHYSNDIDWREPEISKDSIAFLQYTSGSTGQPKGVLVSHGNLLNNETVIQQAFNHNMNSIIVGWLPLYHDMGLIGNLLQPFFLGVRSILMSPQAFIQKPVRWLRAISHYQATTSGGPNFAYDLCVRKISEEQKQGLDLERWLVAFNGSEVVRAETMERFSQAFASTGFSRAAFYPCYGMAEITLFATGVNVDRAPLTLFFDGDKIKQHQAIELTHPSESDNALRLASSGFPAKDGIITIVNPQTCSISENGDIGEIWLNSPSVCQGYWQKPELSQNSFKAEVVDQSGKPFLRTGDLGFIHAGELFVTGRLKELIIIRGRNHYPYDIEKTVQASFDALEPGGGAAFSYEESGEERLVVIQEVKRTHLRRLDDKAVFKAVQSAISEVHELQLYDLVLIKPSRIPKTSSGKIKRKECQNLYINNQLEELAQVSRFKDIKQFSEDLAVIVERETQDLVSDKPLQQMLQYLTGQERQKAVAGYLRSILAQILKYDTRDIDLHSTISGFGLDSLAAVEFQQKVKSDLGIDFDLEAILDQASIQSLSEVASVTDNGEVNAGTYEIPSANNPKRSSPLALNQKALWFLHQLAPQSPAYNLGLPVRLNIAIDVTTLTKVVERLVGRHPILGSRLDISPDGNVVQRLDASPVDISVIQAQNLISQTLKEEVESWNNKPFDLTDGKLMRVVLFDLASEDHIVLFTLHHIVCDLWSLQLLLKDFSQFYSAALSKTSAKPIPTQANYFDFVSWQQQWLSSKSGKKARTFWLKQLAGLPPVLNLPLDRQRLQIQTYNSGNYKFSLPAKLSSALGTFARDQETTLFATLLTIFKLTMRLFSGQNDICTGVPAAGRSLPEFADVIGYFVSPMAIRNEIGGGQTLTEILAKTRRSILTALEHQHFPLHSLLDELCPIRDPAVNPLYQTWFQLEQPRQLVSAAPFILGDEAEIELNGLKLSSFAMDEPGAKLDLALTLVDLGDSLSGQWVFNSDLFDRSTIKAIHQVFLQVAQTLLERPDQRVDDLSFNQDGLMYGKRQELGGSLLHQGFEQQAASLPQRTALIYNEQELSYGQLNEYSNRIARYLLDLGVQTESRIVVCMPRSAKMIAAQLAVLKVGAAFIPLDPAYPKERLQYVVEDAKAAIILTQQKSIVFDHGVTVVNIDDIDEQLAIQSSDNPDVTIHNDNLAYLIYTSGSTGHPKGVMISHRNVENFFAGMDNALDEPEATAEKTWLAVTSASFDISILELFWTLTRGFKVVIQPEQTFRQAAITSESSKPIDINNAIDFSLFYFADDVSVGEGNCYQLLLDSARFADQNGFEAIWVPERHFHSFGGQYPNPSLAAAAVAAVTQNIQLRAGSVVLPLHDPVRVAEEWSMVDNFSNGRVGISITPGWNPNDFILRPESFETRHNQMYQAVDTIQRLWKGETISRENGKGEMVDISTFPRPVQPELPVWITAAGHPDTFRSAGTMGANLLTHLLGQNISELKDKLDIYRQARSDAGFDPDTGHITLMMHTFITDDQQYALNRVEQPFKSYLRSSVGLMKPLADQLGIDFKNQQELLVDQGFQRYSTTSALFGTPQSCIALVDQIKALGVNEIACLIDFGIEPQETVECLKYLAQLRQLARQGQNEPEMEPSIKTSLSATELLQQHDITHLQCTPSFARMLLQESEQQRRPIELQKLLVGGEAFPLDLVDSLKERDIAALYNMYGPTETTIWSSVAKVYELKAGEMTLGSPISNTGLYVLNEALQPVPINVEGELYINGSGLARGYWLRPELTAENFIPDPFASGSGARMYRTGDIVKRTSSGELHYIGRSDNQIKVNGFRIEPGEIETVIAGYAQVSQVVVIAEQLDHQNCRLKAFVVADQAQLKFSQLQKYMSQHLPDYMIPSRLEFIPAMPLTPNGKVDRKALKTIRGENLSISESPDVAPQTPLQQKLADIWMALLKLDRISIHGNFFTLGGHSLLATRLVTLIQEEAAIELSLQEIFVNPTIAKLAGIIESRTANDENSTMVSLPVIVPDQERRYQPFPLTAVQQAYWLGRGSNFELGNISTHVYFEFALAHIDLQRLTNAWRQLIVRHDMLRAVFLTNGMQQVLEHTPDYVIELKNFTDTDESEALAFVRDELSHQVLDTAQWPLFDIRVSRCRQNDILHISMDVLIADGLSTVMLFREWSQLFHQPDFSLPELSLSFRDCVLAEQALSETSQYRNAKDYWLQQIDGLPMAPELPLAKSPGSLDKPHFVRRSFHLDQEKWQVLQAKAQQHGLTPSGILIGAFAEVLTLWSKHPGFTINLTLFNRLPMHPQIGDLVGDFTSLTLLGVNNSEQRPFVERVLATQKKLWQDLDHRLFNGVEVLRELAKQKGRASAAMPVVFTSALGLGSMDGQEAGIENLGELVYGISQTPQVWLDHQVMEYQGGLLFNWDAVEELFPVDMLQSMFDAYVSLLLDLVTNEAPWQQSSPTKLLPEQHRLLVEQVNQTIQPQSEALLHTLFAEQAEKTPDHLAVITPEKKFTYRQLLQHVTQVTHRLILSGVKQGDIVAISMDKGWQQVVAVYATLFAGAAYVPVDPDLPPQRIAYLIEQTEAAVILIQSDKIGDGIWPDDCKLLAVEQIDDGKVDEDKAGGDKATHQLPKFCLHPNDLAYIIFTSGSTGVPKGVMIDHKGAVNTVLDINDRFNVTGKDRVLAISSLSFDLSVYDIFGILATGAAMVLPSPEGVKEPAHWLELIQQHNITMWNSVPALMQMLSEHIAGDRSRANSSLRVALLSGDWIPLKLPQAIQALWPDIQTISLGGATEASIWSIYYPIDKPEQLTNCIPYGKPLTNQHFYVFNQNLELSPLWVTGQLYIGGIGLAQGYWKDDEKTVAAFITHPQTGQRLYRTGDMGRYLADGNIEFMGREDSQVKINGYRVELGEVERVLQQYPDVKDAVALTYGERSEQQLVAYFTQENASTPEANGKEWLTEFSTKQLNGVLTDVVERAEFKLHRHGLRQWPEQQRVIYIKNDQNEAVNQVDIVARQSYREYQQQAIALNTFCRLIGQLQQSRNRFGTYHTEYLNVLGSTNIEIFIWVKNNIVNGLPAGGYHYLPKANRLCQIETGSDLRSHYFGPNKLIFKRAGFAVFMTGAPGIDNLIESGAVSQLLMQTAPRMNIGFCPIGRVSKEINTIFPLAENRVVLHSLVGGAIDPEQQEKWMLEQQPAVTRLTSFMSTKLPGYMVPDSLIELDDMPLTGNGKVNRKALPKPDPAGRNQRAFVEPSSDTERTLAEHCCELLNLQQIGCHDNFFEVGGNSLTAAQLNTKIRETFKLELSLRTIFEQGTIAQLGATIDLQRDAAMHLNVSDVPDDDMERMEF